MAEVLQNPAKVVMFDFIKRFIERVSCGFLHVDASCIVIDALLTKKYRHTGDTLLTQALAVTTVLLRDYGMAEANSVMDVVKCIDRNAAKEIHEYEFFKTFKAVVGPENDEQVEKDATIPPGEEPRIDVNNV